MENLEEVLQALDEFQKMRPTDIPRELEEYLCWVAKTGDPVYQWPMIKTLFREKLTRVMTEFYESCPTLELAPCPNVEHFNYDTMKSNLLERLESFANAPFTVQRICELLTAPRKEYNRVDKFMRAIEKNILVVSTREPGPIARRGETGDSMVNGSVEEDTASLTQQQPPPPSPSPSPQTTTQSAQPTTQPSATQDVEMEYWEKDCASTVTISVHTVENETSLLHTVVPGAANSAGGGSALAKNAVFSADEAAREKLEQAVSRSQGQLTTSNFIGATSDFSAISNLTSQVTEQSRESVTPVAAAAPVVQNLPTPAEALVTEDSALGSADVADAIMNEDTNSQVSLDMENDEVDPATTATTTTTTTTTTTATTTTTTTTATTTTTTTGTTSPSTTSSSSSPSSATTTVTVVATVIPLTTDTTRNLQAAFQVKRFEDADDKCSDKPDESPSTASLAATDEAGLDHCAKSSEVGETSTECDVNGILGDDDDRLTENSPKPDVDVRVTPEDDNAASSKAQEEAEVSPHPDDVDEEKPRCPDGESAKAAQTVFIGTEDKDNSVAPDECTTAVIVSSGEASHRTEETELEETCATTTADSPKDSHLLHDQAASQKLDSMDVVADQVLESIPRLPSSRNNEQAGAELHSAEFNGDGTKMMEISNDKAALVESMVVEKAREAAATVIEKFDSSVSPVVEMTDTSVVDVVCPCPQDDALMHAAEDDSASAAALMKAKQSSVIESNVACRRETHDQVEMMEVDDEESAPTFQQQQLDEQMEHETMEEMSKS